MRHFVFVLIALLAAPAAADPEKLWTLPFASEDIGVIQMAVVPERNRALAAVGNFDFQDVWSIDIDTGEVAEVISPISQRYGGINHIAASSDHIAILIDNGAGIKERAFEVLVYGFDTFQEQRRLTVPTELKGYNPILGSTLMWIDGPHLLLGVQLWEPYQNVRPYLLQYDLTSGEFIRTISMHDMLPEAQDSADKPVTPDYFFAGSVMTRGAFYSAPLPWDTPEPIRGIGFDLNTGKMAPALPVYDGSPRFTGLLAVDDKAITYALRPPFSTSNVVSVGAAIRVDRATNDVIATYPDPFAPEDTEMSFDDFVLQNITTGLRPYTGSWYPERASVDAGYFVGSAPNAPAGGPVGSGALIVYRQDGTPYAIIGSDAPKADLFFGRDFAHAGQYIFTSDKNPAIDHYAARSLVLYRLD